MKHIWYAIRKNLIAGLLVLIPAGATAWFVLTVWVAVNVPLYDLFEKHGWYKVPGVGLFVVIAGIYLVGLTARSLVGRYLISTGEAIVNRLPFVGKIYSALKQILETVLSEQSKAFRQAVLLEYPRRGIWTVAFLTGDVADVMEGEIAAAEADRNEKQTQKVYCFVPTTPNPTSGYLILVPKQDLIPLDISIEDAIRLIISGGVVSPYKRAGKADLLNDLQAPVDAGDVS